MLQLSINAIEEKLSFASVAPIILSPGDLATQDVADSHLYDSWYEIELKELYSKYFQ